MAVRDASCSDGCIRSLVADLCKPGHRFRPADLARNMDEERGVESLLPTFAILLQIHTSFMGPYRALTSPVLLAYFLFIILSTLHLDVKLSFLSGAFSAAGYCATCVYLFVLFPEVAAEQKLLAYGSAVSNAVLLFLGGCAAAAVASQIRLHVVSALHEAENRASREEDMRVAQSIQQGLLPTAPPAIEGFDVGDGTRPPMRRVATTSTGMNYRTDVSRSQSPM